MSDVLAALSPQDEAMPSDVALVLRLTGYYEHSYPPELYGPGNGGVDLDPDQSDGWTTGVNVLLIFNPSVVAADIDYVTLDCAPPQIDNGGMVSSDGPDWTDPASLVAVTFETAPPNLAAFPVGSYTCTVVWADGHRSTTPSEVEVK